MAVPLTPTSGGAPGTAIGPEPGASADTLLLVVGSSLDAPHGAAAELTRRLSPNPGIEAHLLPLAAPTHGELARILARTAGRVVAVPLALGACDPLLEQTAGLLRWARSRWPGRAILQSVPLGAPAHVVGWAAQQLRAVLAGASDPVPSAGTAVLLVGRGSSSPAANAEVCAIARLLWEHGQFDLVETAFLDDGNRPSLATRIDLCRHLGARRVVLLPLTLLDGPLVSAVREGARAARDLRPGIEVVVTGPLLSPGAAAAVVRQRHRDALVRWLATGDDGLTSGHTHGHGAELLPEADDLLPPRYRGGQTANPAPMRSAPLRYDAEGRVAWGDVWQSFCDLALAGGPPHRGTLLEPPLRDEIVADPEGHARVAAEIARGLALVTRLPVVTDRTQGWVGLVCPDEEMAIWMLRAITVENVSVRREGATLFLPAGPKYRVEKEIRNVVTAVAKTHHYWTEHRWTEHRAAR